jgi:uncharacterized protein
MNRPGTAWLFTDGAAGNLKQAQVLARGLNLHAHAFSVRLGTLDRSFAPHWRRANLADLVFDNALPEQIPALAIGCGRAGAVALDALKRAHPQLRTVQILDPRCDPARFDAVVCPAHDALRGKNVFSVQGALHEIDDAWLSAARDLPGFSVFPTLLLLGAPTRNAPYGAQDITRLVQSLPVQGLRISTSRRTPPALLGQLDASVERYLAASVPQAPDTTSLLARLPRQTNPYQRWLGGAQRIVVTPDSVNMISEACATRAQVDVAFANQARGKIARFIASIEPRLGAVEHAPLRPMAGLIAQLRAFLSLP